MENKLFEIDENDLLVISKKRRVDEDIGVKHEPFMKEHGLIHSERINNLENDLTKLSDGSSSDLGIDEAVSVHTRRNIAKLDDEKLLSSKGLIWIVHQAPERMRWKGKTHEFDDLRRLLSFYQVWAHELFPKARFREILRMIQKRGHSKRIKVARAQWIRVNREDLVQVEDRFKVEKDELEIQNNLDKMEEI